MPAAHDPPEEACRERALALLTLRPHSTGELRRKLRLRGFPPPLVERVLADLARVHLLDDRAFVREFIAQKRSSSRPVGRLKIIAELRRRGITADTLDEAGRTLDEDDGEAGVDAELTRATTALQSRLRLRRPGRDPRAEQASWFRFLIGRGFTPALARRAVAQAAADAHASADD